MRPCWILTYERTGSWYLCRLLNATGAFDPPFKEYYHVEPHCNLPAEPPPFVKILSHHHTNAREQAVPLYEHFPDICFVYLRRRDLVAATVSSYFLRHDEVSQIDVSQAETKLKAYQTEKVPFHPERLVALYRMKVMANHYWDDFVRDKLHLEVYYEDLTAEPEKHVRRIMKMTGARFDLQDSSPVRMTVKLEHPDKAEYTRRLREILAKRGAVADQTVSTQVPAWDGKRAHRGVR